MRRARRSFSLAISRRPSASWGLTVEEVACAGTFLFRLIGGTSLLPVVTGAEYIVGGSAEAGAAEDRVVMVAVDGGMDAEAITE